MKYRIVTASINEDTLKTNLLSSKLASEVPVHVMRGYDNVPKAYNTAIWEFFEPSDDFVIFMHDDVYLPEDFRAALEKQIDVLMRYGVNHFGIAGLAGAAMERDITGGLIEPLRRVLHGHVMDRGREWGKASIEVFRVDTVDELMLIVHADLIHLFGPNLFDESFPLDFYGADISMKAKQHGLQTYAISAFAYHNSSRPFGGRTPGFFQSKKYFEQKWYMRLPIATTCTICQ